MDGGSHSHNFSSPKKSCNSQKSCFLCVVISIPPISPSIFMTCFYVFSCTNDAFSCVFCTHNNVYFHTIIVACAKKCELCLNLIHFMLCTKHIGTKMKITDVWIAKRYQKTTFSDRDVCNFHFCTCVFSTKHKMY